jgi:hypothetical protein
MINATWMPYGHSVRAIDSARLRLVELLSQQQDSGQ